MEEESARRLRAGDEARLAMAGGAELYEGRFCGGPADSRIDTPTRCADAR